MQPDSLRDVFESVDCHGVAKDKQTLVRTFDLEHRRADVGSEWKFTQQNDVTVKRNNYGAINCLVICKRKYLSGKKGKFRF